MLNEVAATYCEAIGIAVASQFNARLVRLLQQGWRCS